MQIDNFLNSTVDLESFINVDVNGVKNYKKKRKIRCYKKQEKYTYTNIGTENITQTIVGTYYIKEKLVKVGDLLGGKEVIQIQNYKKIGLDCIYVK